MISENRLSPVKRSSMCASPVKSGHKKKKSCQPLKQDPYSLQTMIERKHAGVIQYSPSKRDKENGSSIGNEELMNSIHQLSQTFEQREPLSPSKIKLHNNTNSQYSSNMSEVTFSPSKHKNKSKQSSVRSSISPSKFERFVKIDPQTISNPFVIKKEGSKKNHIKNSITYQERASSKPSTENVGGQPKQRRAKSDRKNQSKLKSRPTIPQLEVKKASLEVFQPQIIGQIDPHQESLTAIEPQNALTDEVDSHQKSFLEPAIIRPDNQKIESRVIELDHHKESLTLSELQTKALQIEQSELELKNNLDNIVIPSLASVESANSQQTAQVIKRYSQMMDNIEIAERNSSAYKLLSNFNTNEDHQKSINQLREFALKQNTSCNVEYENFYEQELAKLKTDLVNLQQTEDELIESNDPLNQCEETEQSEHLVNVTYDQTEETTLVGNGLFSDIQEFKSNLDKIREFEFGSSTSEEQRVSVLENTIRQSSNIDEEQEQEFYSNIKSSMEEEIAIVSISPPRKITNEIIENPELEDQEQSQEPPSANSFKIQLSCIIESPTSKMESPYKSKMESPYKSKMESPQKSQMGSPYKNPYTNISARSSPYSKSPEYRSSIQGQLQQATMDLKIVQEAVSQLKSIELSSMSSPNCNPHSPKKHDQSNFKLRPLIVSEKKFPIKARRDRKISPTKSKSPEKNYYDPTLDVKSKASKSPVSRHSPVCKASPSMRHVSPQNQTIDVSSSYNASSINVSQNGRKERRSKKSRSTSTKNGKAVRIPKVIKAPENPIRDLGETFKSFDNQVHDIRCPSTIEHTKRDFEQVQKSEGSPDRPRQPIILSQGIFDNQFDHSHITQSELKHSHLVSPTSTVAPANIMLPVQMNEEGTPQKGRVSSMFHLQQQQEPEDSPSPIKTAEKFKTAEKITLFQPKHIKPSKLKEVTSRKQTIKQAEQMLRITEQKVDLVQRKNDFDPNFCQRSFYGEEKNERPSIVKNHQKVLSRSSMGSFNGVSNLQPVRSVKKMNQVVDKVNQKMKDKYSEPSVDKHCTQKIDVQKYFQKPEDLRSRSGSKIGCGIKIAMSGSKPSARSRLPNSAAKPAHASKPSFQRQSLSSQSMTFLHKQQKQAAALKPQIITQAPMIPELKKCPSTLSNTAPVSVRKSMASSTKKAVTGQRFNVVRKSQILGKKSVVQKMNDFSTYKALVSPMNSTLISSQSQQFLSKSKSNPRGSEMRYTTLDGQSASSHARVRALGMKK